ncbi:hypothetical protein MKW98_016212 [Papaver atlanticum]|uniref:Uncharacterized protein n=1 Tax=Papaver atlanticum TaxID=357466 RepID=A0AAD4SH12_9MAGN|nr:hypothetical protein MKW98_016212 [Papaver atlanticum]
MSVLNGEDIFMDAISDEISQNASVENDLVEIVNETQEISALGKRLFSEISPTSDDFPPESGYLQVVVNQYLSGVKEKPDFNFETADAHFSFSKSLSKDLEEEEEGDHYYTPYRELTSEGSQASFKISFDSPDPIEIASSLGSNSEEIEESKDDNPNGGVSIDQFGSFLELM